eukprot:10892187-Ditylum_brightwellii.AAC.1
MQEPTKNQRTESLPPTNKHNNQQHKEIPRDCYFHAASLGQGNSKPFGSCPLFPKQLLLQTAILIPETGRKGYKR